MLQRHTLPLGRETRWISLNNYVQYICTSWYLQVPRSTYNSISYLKVILIPMHRGHCTALRLWMVTSERYRIYLKRCSKDIQIGYCWRKRCVYQLVAQQCPIKFHRCSIQYFQLFLQLYSFPWLWILPMASEYAYRLLWFVVPNIPAALWLACMHGYCGQQVNYVLYGCVPRI